jgi:hypothetical protein
MARKFGPVGTSIWDSEKFLSLSDDTARLGYLYLIACPHGNAVGLFRLPAAYLAADRRTTPQVAVAMLDELVRVGLIELGESDQIRIVNWFYQDTGASNPSTASAFCKSFGDHRLIKRGPLRTKALVEMIFATLTKAEGWNPETQPYSRMVKDIQALLLTEIRNDQGQTWAAIRAMTQPEGNTLLHTMLDTVSYTLGGHGVLQGGGHTDTEKDTEKDTDRERETDTGQGHGEGSPEGNTLRIALPSLPANRGQAGRPIPEDLGKLIKSMTDKAGPRKK